MKWIRKWLACRRFKRDYNKGIVVLGLFKQWPEADKTEYINQTMKVTCQMLMSTFYLIGLKEGMSCEMHNEPTGEVFQLSFKKVNKTKEA